ncbi:hypothetical protein Poli38472_002231 [Pythium oligandrum]|uniref:Ricin B lectin domain-containing protein n=1 Tax=Pythium oligandrum TaxID=41045 RepID=A0A8K1CIE4_PYTOL|nr:hypothetical protein Poli38472_002231 [Pythium oligandrum]|eukprot:TMW63290.1 hypothetical protein Poli38472_002231 [Pythium oligandrum]
MVFGRRTLAVSVLTVLASTLASNHVVESLAGPLASNPDPFVTYHDGWYYLTGTAGSRIPLKRAKTLQDLKTTPSETIFTNTSEPGLPNEAYWAPELHRLEDKWYIYFSARYTGKNERMFVLENANNNPLEGKWTYKGLIDPTNDRYSLDGTILQLRNQTYLVYSGIGNGPKQNLYVTKLKNPWTVEGNRTFIKGPEYDFEMRDSTVTEGPAILKKNGKVFLTYSGSACNTNHYSMGLMWMNESDDPMKIESWHKIDHPVFQEDAKAHAFGPGHNNFFKSPDGKEDWFAYHATTTNKDGCSNRVTFTKRVDWDANGFPVFGTPSEPGKRYGVPSGEPAVYSNSTLANGIYLIQAASDGRVVQAKDCSYNPNTPTVFVANTKDICQQWKVQAATDGAYAFAPLKGGRVLGLKDCKTDASSPAVTLNPNGKSCEKWHLRKQSNGNWLITSAANADIHLQVGKGTTANFATLDKPQYKLVRLE